MKKKTQTIILEGSNGLISDLSIRETYTKADDAMDIEITFEHPEGYTVTFSVRTFNDEAEIREWIENILDTVEELTGDIFFLPEEERIRLAWPEE